MATFVSSFMKKELGKLRYDSFRYFWGQNTLYI